MKTAEGMEEPAKNWQIAALEQRLNATEQFQARIDSKLDLLLEKQVTSGQLDQRIDNVQKSLDTEIEKIHLKYSPLAKNLSRMGWGVVSLVIAQAVAWILKANGWE